MSLLLYAALSAVSWHSCLAADPAALKCLSLQKTLHIENTMVLNTEYVAGARNVTTPGSCQSTAKVEGAPLCRVQFVVNTTSTSSVYGEAWLPDTWYGRFLTTGNGGLGGCPQYSRLNYGSSMHFATVGTDNGHDGNTGLPFLHHPEVINDFAFRAIHVVTVVGKQIVAAHYGAPAAKAYYLGCSTGGRQGTQAALRFPDDFDGIAVGAPATDWNHLIGSSGIKSHYVGGTAPAPFNNTSPKFIPAALWPMVSAEILRQCDGKDGVLDGIITEPDDCAFNPAPLACKPGQTADCLRPPQIQALRNIYSPLLDKHGKLLFPRFTPGAEADPKAAQIFGGPMYQYTADWERYVMSNVTSYDFTDFSVRDIARWDAINAGGIATFDGDLSAFRARGGKFLSWHGRRDPTQLIPAANSKRVYELVAQTLRLRPHAMDAFYRLFLVPGMAHCFGGVGAGAIGQDDGQNAVNTSSHNVLLALVDWVEGGKAPSTIVGTAEDGTERTHCRYPMRSVFDGRTFVCVQA
ncbi:tannase and feruloyl esterase [Mycena belliarum]|uniref:Carboxylic ester hydrolase n=1 Tax=Mycena belliarum TaxID=1033014 RepID=A0AAD6TN24_9AGAR|nr:tannase and feruloyl esterase [Mycena belliae]